MKRIENYLGWANFNPAHSFSSFSIIFGLQLSQIRLPVTLVRLCWWFMLTVICRSNRHCVLSLLVRTWLASFLLRYDLSDSAPYGYVEVMTGAYLLPIYHTFLCEHLIYALFIWMLCNKLECVYISLCMGLSDAFLTPVNVALVEL